MDKSIRTWPNYPIITAGEHKAVKRVLDRGLLQGFRASAGPLFLGGPEIRRFEDLVAKSLGVEYAVSYSSATAALHGAVVACGVEPLDEVIVTPYSFNSSAVAPLYHNAIPVFADINAIDFGLDPASIEERITQRTKAIIVVHLFGIPAQMDAILEIARKHDLAVIEDSAQAPLAIYGWSRYTGTMGDCGIFSFVGEKNASCGEGGMLVTNDPGVARIARLVRNHGDALYEPMLGYNYRMTEMQAAIAYEQWAELKRRNAWRRYLVDVLQEQMDDEGICGVEIPRVSMRDTPAWYALPFYYDERVTGVPRGTFVERMCDEGVPFGAGYIKPLHLLPLFEQRAHFAYEHYEGDAQYYMGLCPVAEELWRNKLIITSVVRPPATESDMQYIAGVMKKALRLD